MRRLVFVAMMALACGKRAPAASDGGKAQATQAASMPPGYVKVTVQGVVKTTSGDAVLLVDDSKTTVLPVFVGGTEALTIKLRLDGKHYTRPLTHDLLSDMMHKLDGAPVQVQVDDLKNDTFIGSAMIERGDGNIVALDARPSDCIALALGEKIPIFVKKKVMDSAGVPKSELDPDRMSGSGRDPLSL